MDWFLGLFGAGSGSCNEGNCKLRDHLRKCAGLGQRPGPVDCDHVNTCMRKNDPKKEEKDAKENDPCPERVMPPIFIPKCSVPPTTTFRCTDWPCEDCEKGKEKKK